MEIRRDVRGSTGGKEGEGGVIEGEKRGERVGIGGGI